jgi:hypothetical protein
MRAVVLISLLSSVACAAQTPAVCPWFSSGSAASVLGGPVVLNSHIENNSEGMCKFTRASGDEKQYLEITIGKADTHLCAQNGTKLIALGNEAVQCKNTSAQGQTQDVIAGRIRKVFFAVSIANIPGAAEAAPPAAHAFDPYAASLLERIAEQVAGSLY